MGNKKFAPLVAAALMAGPLAANASAVTYDFTGVVTSATGAYASAGATVSGTYTFDIGAGIPSQSSFPVSYTSYWYSQAGGGQYGGGGAVPSALVFSSVLTSGGISYSSTLPSSFGSVSDVYDYNENSYTGEDAEYTSIGAYVYSNLQLYGGYGPPAAPFDANGLPIVANATSGKTGELSTNVGQGGQLDYTITSLTVAPVPLPAAGWLFVGGLSGLGAFARKKRAA